MNSVPEQAFSSTKIGSKIWQLLENLLQNAYQHNKIVKNLIAAKKQDLQKIPTELARQGIKLAMKDLTIKKISSNKKLYIRNKMYVPNDQILQLFLLQQHHNSPVHSHLKFKTMLQNLQNNWF